MNIQTSLVAEQIRLQQWGDQISIIGIDAEHDRSMREVYGLDKSLREC